MTAQEKCRFERGNPCFDRRAVLALADMACRIGAVNASPPALPPPEQAVPIRQERREAMIIRGYRSADDLPGEPFLSSRGAWGALRVERRRLPALRLVRPVETELLIAVHVGVPAILEGRGDHGSHAGLMGDGDVQIAVPGTSCDHLCWGESEKLLIRISAGETRRIMELNGAVDADDLIPQWQVRDPFLTAVAHALSGEIQTGHAGGRAYAESLGMSLVLHLARSYSARPRFPALVKGGLPPKKLQAAIEYLEAHIGEDPGLVEMAAATGLSPYHFARCFKQSTGMTPHRYLVGKRVELVKRLLATSGLPIVDVALAAGFSSQSHMTTVFRKLTGTTPRMFRNAISPASPSAEDMDGEAAGGKA